MSESHGGKYVGSCYLKTEYIRFVDYPTLMIELVSILGFGRKKQTEILTVIRTVFT